MVYECRRVPKRDKPATDTRLPPQRPDWGPRRGLLLQGDLPAFLGVPLPWEESGRETLGILAGNSVSETPSVFSSNQHYLDAPTAGLPAAAPGLRNGATARVQHCAQRWSAKTRVTLSMLLSSRSGMVARGNTETTTSPRILSFSGIPPLREAALCWGPREASNGGSPGALKTLALAAASQGTLNHSLPGLRKDTFPGSQLPGI